MKYITENTNGNSIFMPVPAEASVKAGKNGMVRINGNPGNLAISSPKPEALPDGPLMRSAQPSYNSPDKFFPSIYYVHVNDMHPGDNTIRVRSTNEIPIPAKNNPSVPGVAYRPARYGGLRQVNWPPAPQAWQNVASQGGS